MNGEFIKVGFIGCGNMGGAIARAISKKNNTKVYISEPNEQKASALRAELGCEISDNISVCESCDMIFLAIKPGLFSTVIPELKEALCKNGSAIVVTMAAGISLEKLASLCGERKLLRIMPNTPAAIGEGMILWCASDEVTDRERQAFVEVMSECGRLDMLDERFIDAASAISGCGPAFVYMFAEALADGGVTCGLPRDKAMLYAAEMIRGAAGMILATGKHPGVLKDEVCSPGGSTIEGVRTLEEGAFRGVTADAVVSAYEKTKLLGK